jgi:hypothetical protein
MQEAAERQVQTETVELDRVLEVLDSLHVTNHGMYGGYLDVSVMPKTQQ